MIGGSKKRMSSEYAQFAAAWLLLFCSGVGAGGVPPALAATPGSAQPLISGHFALTTLDGREVTEATYRGKWLVMYFGYTHCPDVCPTVLLNVGQALKTLGPLGERIQPLFITVDPERDSAEHLTQYLAFFSPRIVGLRGEGEKLQRTAREFHAYYRRRAFENGEYAVDHSSFLYIMAPDGRFLKLLPDSIPLDQLTAELRGLVNESR